MAISLDDFRIFVSGLQESDEIVVLGGNGGELEIQPDSWRNAVKSVGRFNFFCPRDQAACTQNNAVRRAFRDAIDAEFHEFDARADFTLMQTLMQHADYKAGDYNGGRPLTVRRIMRVLNLVDRIKVNHQSAGVPVMNGGLPGLNNGLRGTCSDALIKVYENVHVPVGLSVPRWVKTAIDYYFEHLQCMKSGDERNLRNFLSGVQPLDFDEALAFWNKIFGIGDPDNDIPHDGIMVKIWRAREDGTAGRVKANVSKLVKQVQTWSGCNTYGLRDADQALSIAVGVLLSELDSRPTTEY